VVEVVEVQVHESPNGQFLDKGNGGSRWRWGWIIEILVEVDLVEQVIHLQYLHLKVLHGGNQARSCYCTNIMEVQEEEVQRAVGSTSDNLIQLMLVDGGGGSFIADPYLPTAVLLVMEESRTSNFWCKIFRWWWRRWSTCLQVQSSRSRWIWWWW
jgi:hypothetical protein